VPGEEAIPRWIEEPGRQDERGVVGVRPAGERLELAGRQPRIVVRHHDERLRRVRAERLLPGLAAALFAELVPLRLRQRAEHLLERLRALHVDAGVEEPRAVAARVVAGERLRDADG